MKILLKNAKILKNPFSPVISGEVHIENGKIVHVGEEKPFVADVVKDCNGNLLMSGFANTHAHSAMTLFRGVADDLPLQTWLFDRIFPLEDHLTQEDIYWGTMLAVAEYARGGVTAVADMYFYDDTIVKAFENSKIALALCSGKNDLGGNTQGALDYMEQAYLKYKNKDRLKYIIGLHAEYTCSDKLIEGTADLANKYDSPTYIHLAETLKEVGDCSVKRKLTPAEYLHKVGFFDNGGIVAHGVYLDKDDIFVLRDKNVTVASCPSSNLKLASGVAPVYSLLENGVSVALGTDGAASNNKLSMFQETYLLSCLQKERMKDASAVSAETALSCATVNGYKAMGFDGGKIEVGYDADIVMLDMSSPCMHPENNVKKSVVFSGDCSLVLMTIAGGKIIYDNGAFNIGETLPEIYKNAERCIKRLLEKAGF